MAAVLGALSNAADAVADAAGSAVDAVANVMTDAATAAACKIAEKAIKDETGVDISIETDDIPEDWKDWMLKTGINSICNSYTWDFLEKSSWNERKVQKWDERKIDKIVLTVEKNPEDDCHWVVCMPEWEAGSTKLVLKFYPRARNWASEYGWDSSAYKRYWILRDEIVFGLQLYQLPGKCFYKSDWLDNFEDVDPDSPLPFGKKKFRRWFQFRHWIIFWYPESQWGWNYQWTTKPPPLADGGDFNLDSILSLPSMPSLSMPSIKLPSLPDIEMPSLPDMPSMPSIEAPSLSAPSLSAPSLGSLPSIPDKPERPKGKWSCHGYVELEGLNVKDKGRTLVLSDAKITHFWENQDTENKEHQRLELECTDEEQATSWKESLVASGATEGEVGGCCTIA